VSIVSAHAKSSRENPAYFAIKTGTGKVNLRTSSSIDWVIEYIDTTGAVRTVNEEAEQNPEKVQIQGTGKIIYIRVYPMKTSVNSDVFLYAENAASVVVSPTVPAPFVASAYPTPTNTPQSPLLPSIGVVSLGIATFLLAKKTR
jgi:hypothetical protein